MYIELGELGAFLTFLVYVVYLLSVNSDFLENFLFP
nr:MAG TPA: hypothetical protein [Caudoviricetes sp.]